MKKFLKHRHYVSAIILLATVLVLLGQHYGWFNSAAQTAQANQPGLYHVTKFDDGDTIAVNMNGSTETIRFIGVDTPETHDPRKPVQCFGMAAANFTKSLIGSNNVRLDSDPLSTNRDRYGRLLRYIYLPDGTLVNAVLIQQGYGFAYLGFPFTKADEFHQYETAAMADHKGLWTSCKPSVNKYGGYTSNNAN